MTANRLAFILGYCPKQVYNWANNRSDAPLRVAITIYYLSGGEVSLSSMLRDQEAFEKEIEELISLTHRRRYQVIKDKYQRGLHEISLL